MSDSFGLCAEAGKFQDYWSTAIDVGVRGSYAVTEWFGLWMQVEGYWLVNPQVRQANRDRGGVTSRNEICVFSVGVDFQF